MAYTKYSLTPADNNAAPPNGAPEGMLPSGVNDTMRDMMSQIRDVGDGIRGGTYTMTAPVITGGSITGVALSGNTFTNPVITGGAISTSTLTGNTFTNPVISGGSINNTPIGATTATTATFTTATVNTLADSQGGVLAPISSVMRNRIINGAMVISQSADGAAVTVNSGSAFFAVDRFKGVGQSSDGVFTLQRDTTAPPGFVNSVKATVTTADTSIGSTQTYRFGQWIEGSNVADLGWGTANAKTVTLSFWVRSSLTGTFGGGVQNDAANRSYPFTYTISAANTWEYKTVTIAGDTTGTWLTNTSTGMVVIWSLGNGTDRSGTAGAWAGANYTSATGATALIGTLSANLYITGCQLERGTQATSFEYRQYTTELALCQRYYWRNTGALYSMHGSGTVFSATLADIYVKLPISMRTAPTISISATQIQVGGTNFTPSAISGASGITTDTAFARLTSSGMTTGQAAILINNNNAAGYFDASSEL